MSHDEMDFAEFFKASWDPCLRAVAASVSSLQLAEDQVAEAFTRALASWRTVSRQLSFGTFQLSNRVETAIALVTTSSNTCASPAPTTLPTGGALLYYPA